MIESLSGTKMSQGRSPKAFGSEELVHKSVLRVNQSKVRRDHDPWHDVAIPLKSDEPRSSSSEEARESIRSSYDEEIDGIGDRLLDEASSGFCLEHEICYHTFSAGKSDFVEITPHLTGLTACASRVGFDVGESVLFGEWSAKKIQSSIAEAWKVIENAQPNHIAIHPVIPKEWPRKATKAFWHFCAEVGRWQDDREGCFVTFMYPKNDGFWSSQCSRSLKWRNSMAFVTLGSQGELSLLSNLPAGSFDRLCSQVERYNSQGLLDPRFTVLLSHCLTNSQFSDQRQVCLFEDIFQDFDDGALCALCSSIRE